jgi:hypothetical protein
MIDILESNNKELINEELDLCEASELNLLALSILENNKLELFSYVFYHPNFDINYDLSSVFVKSIELGLIDVVKIFYKDPRFNFIYLKDDYLFAYEYNQLEVFDYFINSHDYTSINVNTERFINLFSYIIKNKKNDFFELLINHDTFNINVFYEKIIKYCSEFDNIEALQSILNKLNESNNISDLKKEINSVKSLFSEVALSKNQNIVKLVFDFEKFQVFFKNTILIDNKYIYKVALHNLNIEVFKIIEEKYKLHVNENELIEVFNGELELLLKFSNSSKDNYLSKLIDRKNEYFFIKNIKLIDNLLFLNDDQLKKHLMNVNRDFLVENSKEIKNILSERNLAPFILYLKLVNFI